MKMLFKQRFFSWFDSYDIFDESGRTLYSVKGELSWGHLLRVYSADGRELGYIKERVLTWLPKFEIYISDVCVGSVKKELTFFRPRFMVDYNGWHVDGNFWEWDYSVTDASGGYIATVTKELWRLTDTYLIDVYDPENALVTLMLVLAIDAEKCSRNN